MSPGEVQGRGSRSCHNLKVMPHKYNVIDALHNMARYSMNLLVITAL